MNCVQSELAIKYGDCFASLAMPIFDFVTIRNVYDHFEKSLSALYDEGEANAITHLVVEDQLGLTRNEIISREEETISEVKANDLARKLMRLMNGEPVQYVLGYTVFHGLQLKVNKSVLIPRPETEELVEWILGDEKKILPQRRRDAEGIKILDIGTGSGCIAIALKKNLPHAQVYATDISEDALKVAQENTNVNSVQIQFVREDILSPDSKILASPKESRVLRTGFNIIVSNPPYVLPSEKKSLHKNVHDFEPHEALFVPENDPLIFYKAILNFAEEHLLKDGALYFEVNNSYAQEVSSLLRGKNFSEVEVRKDLNGNDRMMKGYSSKL